MARKKIETAVLEGETLPRDISWMYFNRRILQEAMREEVPVLERLSFLGIYSNNLDEFFRVRVATLSRIAESEEKSAKAERDEARAILKEINKLNTRYAKSYEEAIQAVTEALRNEQIHIVDNEQLDEAQQRFVHDFYYEKLNGQLQPVWLSEIKQIDSETDEDIYLAIKMRRAENKKEAAYAILALPVALAGRFVRLPDKEGQCYITYLDDVIRLCLPLIFRGLPYTRFEAYAFKFTKDAEMPKDLLKRLMNRLNLDKLDTVQAGGRYHNHKDLMRFPDCGRKDLKYPRWTPIRKQELSGPESLLEQIRERDRFLHVPYHDFDGYLRVLQEAALNKEVRSIKTTLYRLAKDSKVVKALIAAARNGKKVTVVIELLARFDEASNIGWSKQLQDAGVHVIFGVEGLKVHSKITHIQMRSGKDIACVSTGNFHEGNARMYTDCILMTANPKLTQEVAAVFNFIERPYAPVRFKELLVSPNEMKQKFVRLINQEIKNQRAGLPAYIKMKVNHITDPVMVDKLYEAARAGVKIELLVRGNCALVNSGQAGEPIRIVGIIDRYLEHARIFCFCNNGAEKIFMGSADWMPRNLDNRIEVVTPVYDPVVKEELRRIVDFGLRDTRQGRIVDGTDSNVIQSSGEQEPFRSQEALYNFYVQQEQPVKEEGKDGESKDVCGD